ncbi:MAG TPA: VTT domain-containing protein, partial [Polyangiaceae bacterium]
ALGGLVIALLSADVLLPIPSSFVAAGAVSLLGAVQGGASVFLGMTLAAWLGYALGLWGGQPLATRMAGERELSRARSLMERHGSWLLLLCRGVPVLAEASTLLAGATRLPLLRFALVTALGNAGLSLAYALIGVLRLAGTPALLAPFVFGMAVPGLGLLLLRRGWGFNRELWRDSP